MDHLHHRRSQVNAAVQYAREDPGSLTTGDVLHLQRIIGNRAVSRLIDRSDDHAYLPPALNNHHTGKIRPLRKKNQVADLPSSHGLRIQRKLQLTGGNKKIRARFVKKMNAGRGTKFKIDGSGFIKLKNPKSKGREEYSRKLILAVKDPQTVKLRLIKKDKVVFIDSFASGEVDYNDAFKLSQTMFKLFLLHYIVERFDIKDYEKDKATASAADFTKAHGKGLKSQTKYLKQLFPGKKIKFKSEGLDPKSKKVDKSGNGTIRYIYDFTDVKLIFIQPLVSNKLEEHIIKSIVKVVK